MVSESPEGLSSKDLCFFKQPDTRKANSTADKGGGSGSLVPLDEPSDVIGKTFASFTLGGSMPSAGTKVIGQKN